MKTSRLARLGVAITTLATVSLGLVTGPASADPPGAPPGAASTAQTFTYDALGDSYASGYGVPPYANSCGQSQAAYAVQLDGRMRIHLDDFAACAGAKTADIGRQLGALDADTDLVTISVGGNDILWSTAIATCLGAPYAYCLGAVQHSSGLVTNVLPALLDSVYADISEHAPNAHVVVTGYPRVFSPEYGDLAGVVAGQPVLATVAEQNALNDGADHLNSVIAHAAAEHDFQFVDVTNRFLDHGVNAPEPWLLGPFVQNGAFHPNAAGYRAYTAAVTAAIVPARLR